MVIPYQFIKSLDVHHMIERTRFPIQNFVNFISYLGGLENIAYIKRHKDFEFTDLNPDEKEFGVRKKRYVIRVKDKDIRKELPPKLGEEKGSFRYCIEREVIDNTEAIYKFPEIIDVTCMIEGFEGDDIVLKAWGVCAEWIEKTIEHFDAMTKDEDQEVEVVKKVKKKQTFKIAEDEEEETPEETEE